MLDPKLGQPMANPESHATYLGFDFGEKKTGVAVGQRITGTARGLETIPSANPDSLWAAIGRLVQIWQPSAFVVGIPRPLVEPEQKNPLIGRIERFCRELENRYQIPVFLMDEALSTRESQSIFYTHRSKKSVQFKDIKDELAAQLILETWLNHTALQGQLNG